MKKLQIAGNKKKKGTIGLDSSEILYKTFKHFDFANSFISLTFICECGFFQACGFYQASTPNLIKKLTNKKKPKGIIGLDRYNILYNTFSLKAIIPTDNLTK